MTVPLSRRSSRGSKSRQAPFLGLLLGAILLSLLCLHTIWRGQQGSNCAACPAGGAMLEEDLSSGSLGRSRSGLGEDDPMGSPALEESLGDQESKSESSRWSCAVRVQHLEAKVARLKAKYNEELAAREAAEKRADQAEERESQTREAANLAAAQILEHRVESGTMPKFGQVEVSLGATIPAAALTSSTPGDWRLTTQFSTPGTLHPNLDPTNTGGDGQGDNTGEGMGDALTDEAAASKDSVLTREQVEEQQQEKQRQQEAKARRIWLQALHKAAPALVGGLPLQLPQGSAALDHIFATTSTFYLSHSGPAGVPEDIPELTPEDLALFPDRGSPPKRYETCAIVGNARSLLSADMGEEIDAHDAVMRINQASTLGYETQVGNKTTWRLVNRKWATAYKADTKLMLEQNCTLLCSRTTWELFIKVARAVQARRPDVKLMLASREAVDSSGAVLRELKSRVEQVRGVPYMGKASPSSGFVGMYLLLQMCSKVTLYGIGDGMVGSWHYFEDRIFSGSREFGLDPHHSFELEHDMLQVLDAGGFITHKKIDDVNATFAIERATAAQKHAARLQELAELEEMKTSLPHSVGTGVTYGSRESKFREKSKLERMKLIHHSTSSHKRPQ